jgi:heavy metal-binding protein
MRNVQKSSGSIRRFCSAVALSLSFYGSVEAKPASAVHGHELTEVALAEVVGGHAAAHHHADHSELNTEGARYTCPMHPEVVSESPGRCPHCGMKLVEQEQRPEMTAGS